MGPLGAFTGHASEQAAPQSALWGQNREPRMPEWGAFLCGAISILEILDPLYRCPMSPEGKPQIVSLGDKCLSCQMVRNSTRNGGGREANSPGCSGDRSSMTPHFPPRPTSVRRLPALLLRCGSLSQCLHGPVPFQSSTDALTSPLCWGRTSVPAPFWSIYFHSASLPLLLSFFFLRAGSRDGKHMCSVHHFWTGNGKCHFNLPS